ncbi:MAG: hypothetical protein GXP40_05590 [Chloroflexi bacterium]|nr:hypothetical protein [Chloroflexota bacterium]
MAPVVHGLEAKYYGRIDFVYLDIDDPRNDALKKQFGFQYQPMFVLVDGDGTALKTWLGYVPAEDFETAFVGVVEQ